MTVVYILVPLMVIGYVLIGILSYNCGKRKRV